MRVSDDVLQVLSTANVDGNSVVLFGQLDRKLYERTNKVLEAAGGKWNRKAKAHLFDGDASERIDQIILTGDVEVPRDEFEFFPTPPDIVDRLMELADVRPGMAVLEPSAGRGAIAFACANAGATVDCYELMEANRLALTADIRVRVVGADFMDGTIDTVYDRVVMNPPFARQADIRHVTRALEFIRPTGLLVSVMSAGVAFRNNGLTTDFRSMVESRGGFIESLPDGAFKSSGTMVRTVAVVIPGGNESR